MRTEVSPKKAGKIEMYILYVLAIAVIVAAYLTFFASGPLTDDQGRKRKESDCLRWGVVYKEDGDVQIAPLPATPDSLAEAQRMAKKLEEQYYQNRRPGMPDRDYEARCEQWKP